VAPAVIRDSVGYLSPEAAVESGAPPGAVVTLGSNVAPSGRFAVVLYALLGGSELMPYQTVCERTPDGWTELITSNGPGWAALPDSEESTLGVQTYWQALPPGRDIAIVSFRGKEEHLVASNGYVLFVAWDVPDNVQEWPRISFKRS
jgi:hypothetical protein